MKLRSVVQESPGKTTNPIKAKIKTENSSNLQNFIHAQRLTDRIDFRWAIPIDLTIEARGKETCSVSASFVDRHRSISLFNLVTCTSSACNQIVAQLTCTSVDGASQQINRNLGIVISIHVQCSVATESTVRYDICLIEYAFDGAKLIEWRFLKLVLSVIRTVVCDR